MTYTADSVRASVSANEERLFAPWKIGRPEGWTTDARTKNVVCLGFWLREELTKMGLSDKDRITQEQFFHRWSRSDSDLFALVATILNDAAAGNIEQGRIPHHRWG